MMTFLEHAPSVGHLKMMEYAPKGKKPRDYCALDEAAFSRISRFIRRTQGTRRRYTVKRLLAESGFDAAYRKHREWFPKTRRLIYTFRLSSQCVKRIGMTNGPATFSRAHRRAVARRIDASPN
jgi:hypothetical protein